MSSSKRYGLGPATSTMPPAGVPTAILPTARAASSAATGWMLAAGTRTVSPSVAASAIDSTNS